MLLVVEFWREWFARNPDARFEAEEMIVSNDRAVVPGHPSTTRNLVLEGSKGWVLSGCAV